MNIILVILGIGLIALGFSSFIKSKHLSANGISVMAKIIDVKKAESTDEDGYKKISYVPILKYVVEGKSFTYSSSVSSQNKNKYSVGGEMEIVYDPSKPEVVINKGFGSMWLTPVVLMLVGVMLVVGSVMGKFN